MRMIMEDVKGKHYKQLIDLLQRSCDRFAFVEDRRLMDIEEERLEEVEQLFAPIEAHFIERKTQTEWETTSLSDGSAYVYYFNFNNATKAFLTDYSQSLFGWQHPLLPEDVMFYQEDRCILAACSHEKYFLVDQTLWEAFSNT